MFFPIGTILIGETSPNSPMASIYDINIDQGSTFNLLLQLQDINSASIDLTGMAFRSQVRESFESENITFAFTCSVPTPGLGQIYLTLPDNVSSSTPAGRYIYDLEMVSGSIVTRVMQGAVLISPEVTR